MKQNSKLLSAALFMGLCISGCGSPRENDSYEGVETTQPSTYSAAEMEEEDMKMVVAVNGRDFMATLEENSAVEALVEMLEDGSVTLSLHDYAGFEKVGALGRSLPTSDSETTTQSGDIVLYQGNQIVLFYGANSWSYTRLGHIDDLNGWNDVLGSGDVTVELSMEK